MAIWFTIKLVSSNQPFKNRVFKSKGITSSMQTISFPTYVSSQAEKILCSQDYFFGRNLWPQTWHGNEFCFHSYIFHETHLLWRKVLFLRISTKSLDVLSSEHCRSFRTTSNHCTFSCRAELLLMWFHLCEPSYHCRYYI